MCVCVDSFGWGYGEEADFVRNGKSMGCTRSCLLNTFTAINYVGECGTLVGIRIVVAFRTINKSTLRIFTFDVVRYLH